ncbi:MAG: RnfABCDGE type electron transport complex subunit G [Bacteroidales bacterium]|jgi:electron transport complex protein RnfG|nr:RnfABCDGE type electron transport complex subunit G [Bacteroidales bacterium]
MAKLNSSLKNMVMSLAIISFGASAILGGVYVLTKKPIEDAAELKKTNAIKEVLPQNNNMKIGEAVEITLDSYSEKFIVYPAFENDKLIAAAVETFDNNGYGGQIKSMVGFDAGGNIVNYAILAMSETPGLGEKVTSWFKTKRNNQDIRGKKPSEESFKVSKDGGEIDAITASTITSRAFLSSVKTAYNVFIEYQKQQNK